MADRAEGTKQGFIARNKDDLWLEAIGGLVLAFAVSGVMFAIDGAREASRNAHDESLSNSLFIRQAVMLDSDVLPFSGLYLEGAQLSGLTLAGADFSDADLTNAELKGTDLSGASLAESDLTGTDLSGANLTGANLSEATLRDTDMSGAILSGADFSDADLDGAWYLAAEPPRGNEDALATLSAVGAAEADADDDDD